MTAKADLQVVTFASRAAFEAWLEEHHADSDGLWPKIAKKGSGTETVSYAGAVDAALCFGWIDSRGRGFDERFWLQLFTPRRPKGSRWSRANREKAEGLISEGRMRPAGLREVERARSDGRRDAAYDARVPPGTTVGSNEHTLAALKGPVAE